MGSDAVTITKLPAVAGDWSTAQADEGCWLFIDKRREKFQFPLLIQDL